MLNDKVIELLAIVKEGDVIRIEEARNQVNPEFLPDMLDAYWLMSGWDEKAGLIELFSDYLLTDHHITDDKNVMRDILNAPDEEHYRWSKIVALCQLAGTYELFDYCWHDQNLYSIILKLTRQGEKPELSMINKFETTKTTDSTSPRKWWQVWRK